MSVVIKGWQCQHCLPWSPWSPLSWMVSLVNAVVRLGATQGTNSKESLSAMVKLERESEFRMNSFKRNLIGCENYKTSKVSECVLRPMMTVDRTLQVCWESMTVSWLCLDWEDGVLKVRFSRLTRSRAFELCIISLCLQWGWHQGNLIHCRRYNWCRNQCETQLLLEWCGN